MKIKKETDRIYVIDDSGNEIAMAEKQYMGTHGHWRGYLHYVKENGKWVWCGTDRMFCSIPEEVPAWFGSVKEIKRYYNVA